MEKKEARKRVLGIWKKLRALGSDWDAVTEHTRETATTMVNTLLEMEHLTIPTSWKPLTQDGAFPDMLPRMEGRMWSMVHDASAELLKGLEELSDVLVRMRMHVAEMEEVAIIGMKTKQQTRTDDEDLDDGASDALFLVSKLPVFAHLCSEVANMYQQELEAKSAMAAELPSTRDRVTLSAYLSAWTLQVFVDEERLRDMDQQVEAEAVLALPA